MPEAYPGVDPEHECQTCGARYYSEEAASGCPCNPDGQPATVADGGVAISPTADGTHNGQPVATDGGVEATQDSNIHHYECQDCGEELDWVEIETCPSCGSDDLEEIHVITDGSGEQLTDGTYQFSAKIGQSKLAEWLDQLLTVQEEAQINVQDDALHSMMVDPANIALADATLPAESFVQYEVESGEIGLNIERARDVLDRFDDDDVLRLDADDRHLSIHNGHMMFELALIDSRSIRTPDEGPKTEVDSRVSVDSDSVVSLIEAADSVSKHLKLAHEDQRVIGVAEGDTDRATIVLDGDLKDASEEKITGSIYTMDYLRDFIPALEHAEDVEVGLAMEYPLLLSYRLPQSGAYVNLNLAPRIRHNGGDRR